MFIPAYNCEKQIVRVLDQLDDEVLPFIHEVIVVNNLSTDDTEEVVMQYQKHHPQVPLTLLRNHENYGLGGSHKVAFSYAVKNRFDYVIVLHGDDQGDIHDFLPMLRKGIYRKYDCVLGARFMLQSRLKGYSMFRTFGNVVYNFLFAAVVKERVFDLGSGLNMYNTRDLRYRFYDKFPDNLMFNYCMVLASDFYKQKVCYYPISWREDDQVSNVKMVNQAITVLKMLFEYAVNKDSIRSDYRSKKIKKYDADII